jgi:hypothetical protein
LFGNVRRGSKCNSARFGSGTVLACELRGEGLTTPTRTLVDKGCLYRILSTRTYLGLAVHKGTAYPGEHSAIVGQDL